MNVLNLNKRIEDKKQKEYEQDVQRLSKKVGEMLAEEGYRIQAIVSYNPNGIIPMTAIVKMSDADKKFWEENKKKEEAERIAKNISDGKSTPLETA